MERMLCEAAGINCNDNVGSLEEKVKKSKTAPPIFVFGAHLMLFTWHCPIVPLFQNNHLMMALCPLIHTDLVKTALN